MLLQHLDQPQLLWRQMNACMDTILTHSQHNGHSLSTLHGTSTTSCLFPDLLCWVQWSSHICFEQLKTHS
jgi:hypothetical protein